MAHHNQLRFSSMTDLVRRAEAKERPYIRVGKSGRKQYYCGVTAEERSWFFDHSEPQLFTTWKGARESCFESYAHGQKIIDDMRKQLSDAEIPQAAVIRRRRRWSEDDGDSVNPERLLDGDPYWNQSYRTASPGANTVTIVVQIGATASIAARNVFWRGAIALIAADLLESAGYRVRIVGAHRSEGVYFDTPMTPAELGRARRRHDPRTSARNGSCRWTVELKGHDDPLNTGSLATVLSSWFYRTWGFRVKSVDTDATVSTSYGRTASVTDDDAAVIADGDHMVLISDVYDGVAAIEKLREIVGSFRTQPA